MTAIGHPSRFVAGWQDEIRLRRGKDQLSRSRLGQMQLDSIDGIGLVGGSAVQVSERVFAGSVLGEDPRSCAGDRVIPGHQAPSVAEDKRYRSIRFCRRRWRGGCAGLPLLVLQLLNFIG